MPRATRRTFLGLTTALATLPLGATLGCSREAPRRNVIFLLADDQRWDTVGALGNPIIRTPHLDRLAAAGTVFRNHFVTTSICPISRASLLTGLYARRHGVLDFSTPLEPARLAASYPVVLRDAGYFTGFVGKYGLGGELPAAAFDVFDGYAGQGEYFPGDGSVHLTTILGDQAIAFLRRAKEEARPFCLSLSFKAPHAQNVLPYFGNDPAYDALYAETTIPRPDKSDPAFHEALPDFLRDGYRGRQEFLSFFSAEEDFQDTVRRYYRLISGLDAQVGRILDALAELGLDGETAIVFTSDNGAFIGERGLGGKWLMHEESIRTPMIVLDPLTPASHGRAVEAMTLNVDVAPTLSALAGVAPPRDVDGRDLGPLMRGEATEWRADWLYEHPYAHPEIPMSEGVRSERWKYITYLGRGVEELYDLRADPREHANLASDPAHAEDLARMRARHAELVASLEG